MLNYNINKCFYKLTRQFYLGLNFINFFLGGFDFKIHNNKNADTNKIEMRKIVYTKLELMACFSNFDSNNNFPSMPFEFNDGLFFHRF